MFYRQSYRIVTVTIFFDLCASVIALRTAAVVRPLIPETSISVALAAFEVAPFLYVAIPILWLTAFLVVSVYDTKRIRRPVDEALRVVLGSFLAILFTSGLLYLTVREVPRWLFVIFVLTNVSLIFAWRIAMRFVFRVFRPELQQRRVLIVGANEIGQRVGEMIKEYQWSGIHLQGYVDDTDARPVEDDSASLMGRPRDVRSIVRREAIDDVVIALPQQAYRKINQLVVNLQDLPVEVRLVPDYFSLALFRAQAEEFGGMPLISLRDPALNASQRAVKRLFDVAGAGLGLLFCMPFLLTIALLIRLDSPGPVLFRQSRVGENGRLFAMFKFRTMVENAAALQDKVNTIDANGHLIHKRDGDPRVTRVGRVLRRLSLDELPQLVNVLRGEMSLVGPRPELPWLVVRYEPWQQRRFAVPQGITGWWQVNGRSSRPLHLHTEDDLYYIQNYSLWMDLYILLKTPLVVLRGRGAF